MLELISHITTVHWFILALALIGIEVLAPSSYFMWPSASAAVVGVLSWLFGMSGVVEISIFVILAVASSIAWQIWFKPKTENTDRPELNRRASQYVGRKFVLREPFVDGVGYVIVDDSRWRAETDDGRNIDVGTRVEVYDTDGSTFMVREAPATASV